MNAEAKGNGNSGWVLLVDDDANLRKVTCTLLKRAGYKVLTAEDGVKGLELFKENQPEINLVLTDIVMPNMTGTEMVDRILLVKPGQKVAFITGSGVSEQDMATMKASGSSLINKPFSGAELIEIVKSLI